MRRCSILCTVVYIGSGKTKIPAFWGRADSSAHSSIGINSDANEKAPNVLLAPKLFKFF